MWKTGFQNWDSIFIQIKYVQFEVCSLIYVQYKTILRPFQFIQRFLPEIGTINKESLDFEEDKNGLNNFHQNWVYRLKILLSLLQKHEIWCRGSFSITHFLSQVQQTTKKFFLKKMVGIFIWIAFVLIELDIKLYILDSGEQLFTLSKSESKFKKSLIINYKWRRFTQKYLFNYSREVPWPLFSYIFLLEFWKIHQNLKSALKSCSFFLDIFTQRPQKC